jgi:hypothetical protein
MPLTAQTRDRLRLLLAAIGLAIVLLVIMWASFVLIPERYLDSVFLGTKWARFTVVTIVFVAYCLKTYWRARKHRLFWVLLFGVLVLHFCGVGFFFFRGHGLPLLAFGPTVALEWALLALAVYHFLGIGPRPTRPE